VTTWPKVLPPLDPEHKAIIDDAICRWHEDLPGAYRMVERFNHRYPLRSRPAGKERYRTIEIGAGLGEQLVDEDLSNQDYTCVEMRDDMAARVRERFPSVTTIVADCQQRMPFDDGSFDRAIAVHVLEHLPDLPSALDEVHRLLHPGARFGVVIPCDPGMLYGLGRRFTSQRAFEREYHLPYEVFIRREHLNSPAEIIGLLRDRFHLVHRQFFPLRIPSVHLNLCIGITAEVT
jgi:SAM-dependent methyltransferase